MIRVEIKNHKPFNKSRDSIRPETAVYGERTSSGFMRALDGMLLQNLPAGPFGPLPEDDVVYE